VSRSSSSVVLRIVPSGLPLERPSDNTGSSSQSVRRATRDSRPYPRPSDVLLRSGELVVRRADRAVRSTSAPTRRHEPSPAGRCCRGPSSGTRCRRLTSRLPPRAPHSVVTGKPGRACQLANRGVNQLARGRHGSSARRDMDRSPGRRTCRSAGPTWVVRGVPASRTERVFLVDEACWSPPWASGPTEGRPTMGSSWPRGNRLRAGEIAGGGVRRADEVLVAIAVRFSLS
jgi:hypothetical protein